jgi:hypothetical protein
MGLFGGKSKDVACPICAELFNPLRDGQTHWLGHVDEVPPDQISAVDLHTWKCACGPARMRWGNDFSAGMALAIHMYRRHDIPPHSPLDSYPFLCEMEQKLKLRP